MNRDRKREEGSVLSLFNRIVQTYKLPQYPQKEGPVSLPKGSE